MTQLALSKEINLRQVEYHGITLPDKDLRKQGRYKVHIPELHTLIGPHEGIWCKNHLHLWRSTPCHDYFYGQYFPIQPGTKVLVKFYENDYHTGFIEKIISDQVKDTTPKISCNVMPEAIDDRDDVTILFKTPKKHNLFAVLENTKDGKMGLTEKLIPNSIHLYYNYRRTTMIINEDGIHWFTMDNRGVTVEGHNSEWVNKSEKIFIQENRDLWINGEYFRTYVLGEECRTSIGPRQYFSQAQTSIVSGTLASMDAPTIWLNSGKSEMARMPYPNKGEDEIERQNKLEMKIIPHEKRIDTYYGIEKYKIEGGSPTEGHPNRMAIKLNRGCNDRYSTIGATQSSSPITPPPPYPPVKSFTTPGIPAGGGIDDIGGALGSRGGIITGLSPDSGPFNMIPGGPSAVIGGVTGGLDNSVKGLTGGLKFDPNGFSKINELENIGNFENFDNLNDLSNQLGGSAGIASLANGTGLDNLSDSLSNGTFNNGPMNISDEMGGINMDQLVNSSKDALNTGLPELNINQPFQDVGIDTFNNSNPILSGIQNTFSNLGQGINNTLGQITNTETSPLNNLTNTLTNSLDNLTNNIGIDSLFGDLMGSFGIDDISSNLSSQLNNLPNNILSGTGGLNNLINTITSPITKINNFAHQLNCTLYNSTSELKDQVNLFNSGVNNALGKVLNSIASGTSILNKSLGSPDDMLLNKMHNINIQSLFGILSSGAKKSQCQDDDIIDPFSIGD